MSTHSQGPWGDPEPPDWSHGPQLLPHSPMASWPSLLWVPPPGGYVPRGGAEGALLWQPAAPKVGTRCHGNAVPKEERGGRVSWQRLPGMGMLGGAWVGTVMGTQPQHCQSSCAPHSGSHRDPLPCTLGTPNPKVPCSHTPILPHPTGPGGGERRHSSPRWPLGPHHSPRKLRDTGAQAGMRCRDSARAQNPGPGQRIPSQD